MFNSIKKIKYVGGSYWNGYQTMTISFIFNEDLNRKGIKFEYLFPFGLIDKTENAFIYDNEVCSKILNNFVFLFTNLGKSYKYYDHNVMDGEEFSINVTYEDEKTVNYYFYGSENSLKKEEYKSFNEIGKYIKTLVILYFKKDIVGNSKNSLKN